MCVCVCVCGEREECNVLDGDPFSFCPFVLFRHCVPFEESYVIRDSDVVTFAANHGFDDKETA